MNTQASMGQNPGSFQSVNGKMFFFPAIIQNQTEYQPATETTETPYPMDWKYHKNQEITAAHQYTVENYTNAMKPQIASYKPHNYENLPVHFSDPRLNQETSIEYSNQTYQEGQNTPGAPTTHYATGMHYPYMQQTVYHPNYPDMQQGYPAGYTQVAQTPPVYDGYTNIQPYQPKPFQTTTQSPQYFNFAPYNTVVEKPMAVTQKHFGSKVQGATQPPPAFKVPQVEEKEVVHYVTKQEKKFIEQEVYVPGPEKIFVPQPVQADTYKIVPKFNDVEVKFVVSESVTPVIEESNDVIEMEVNKYEPDIQYVDIYVPRPIAIPIKPTGEYEVVEVPSSKISPEQFQKSLQGINPHIAQMEQYNKANEDQFNTYIQQSQQISSKFNFEAPQPEIYTSESAEKFMSSFNIGKQSKKKKETVKAVKAAEVTPAVAETAYEAENYEYEQEKQVEEQVEEQQYQEAEETYAQQEEEQAYNKQDYDSDAQSVHSADYSQEKHQKFEAEQQYQDEQVQEQQYQDNQQDQDQYQDNVQYQSEKYQTEEQEQEQEQEQDNYQKDNEQKYVKEVNSSDDENAYKQKEAVPA